MKSILITGGAGYIGSHTAFLLAQQNYRVIILDLFLYEQTFNPPWVTVIRGDCGDKTLLISLFLHYDIDVVMHFAADIEVGESVRNPLGFYENNVSKTISLLQAMHEYKIKNFIFSSSCAVYGTPQSLPLREDHPINPINPYGKTKAIVESILHDVANAYDIKWVSLRYFNAAGALAEHNLGEQHEPETHIIPLLLDAAFKRKHFFIYGNDYPTIDGTAIRDYLHVLDIAQAHNAAYDYLKAENPSNIFNLGTGVGFSVKQIIEAIENIAGLTITTAVVDRRAGDPHTLVADASKAKRLLHWKPKFSDLKKIISSSLAFYRVKNNILHKEQLKHKKEYV